MACDRCEASMEAGDKFCPYCGQPFDRCPQCETARAEGMRFCPGCGRPLQAPPSRRQGFDIVRTAILVMIPLIALVLVFELALMVLGIGDVWSWASEGALNVLLLKPELTVIGVLQGASLRIYWIALVAAILASVLLVLWQSVPALKAPSEERWERLERTPLFWIALLLCADLLVNIILAIPQLAGGLDGIYGDGGISAPIGTVPDALLSYANAAVWEEVITRVVFIGLPMTVLGICHLRKDSWRFLLGGFGMSRAALVCLAVSSVVFGFAHMSGWGAWKVLPTLISGFALGYLYIRFGIHASIAFHFLVDYLAVMVDGGTAYLASVFIILALLAGIFCLYEVVRRLRHAPKAIREMPATLSPDQESIFSRRE